MRPDPSTVESDSLNKEYRPRVVDSRISDTLSLFGGVLITGPMWCGKSWTGQYHSRSKYLVDKGATLASLDAELVLEGEVPRLVDEWQDAPALWDAARRIIDDRAKPGQFIFTGSSLPPKKSTSHTGTGRFARIAMRPMSLFESGNSDGHVSLSALFNGAEFKPHRSEMSYDAAVRLICRGGWPSAVNESYERAVEVPREYIKAVANSEITDAEKREKKRDPTVMALLMRSLARNTATCAKIAVITEDISRDRKISESTVTNYIEALRRIFVLDEQEAWYPDLRSRVRLRTSPKRHLVDPSLAVAAMRADVERIKSDPNTAGFLFESLCYRDLCVYSSALGGDVYQYGDNTGLEVDSIVELRDGKWGAVEVKLGDFEFDKAIHNLMSLKKKMSDNSPPPSFMMILCATGGVAYTRDDGIMVVPLDCLGP